MSSSTESRLAALEGLTTAKKLVRRLTAADSGVHALLLYGVRGSGKTELANILAEAWLCTRPSTEGADGTCQACRTFSRGTNPDLLQIVPFQPSNIIRLKAITPPQKQEADDPVPLREFFRTPPLMSRHKVSVIHDAHRMNEDAANALLKTLEEPHPHAKLILTTDSVGSVLPTILSRCLAVACELPEPADVLASISGATDDDLRLAEGAPGRLKTILEHPKVYRRISEFAEKLKHRKRGEALRVSEEFRSIADAIERATDCGARNATTEALDLLAVYLARLPDSNPAWPHHVIEAHRRVRGNGGAGIVFDSLFTKLLRRN